MQQIPRMQTEDREINQLQTNIISVINPVLKNSPILFGNILTSVSLAIGNNAINTGLNRTLQGWIIIRKRGPANIYDNQDSNTSAASGTLILNSDAVVSVDIQVF